MTDDLVSVRGLVDSDFDNPLRKFTGNFVGYETEPASGYEGTRVKLNFKELDNVVATSPYNFPTAVLNMGLSNKNKSRWGYFGNSLAALIPAEEDIKDCLDRTMTLVFCDGEEGRPPPKPIWNRDAQTLWKRAVALNSAIAAEKDEAKLADIQAERATMEEVYPNGEVPTPVWVVSEVEGVSAGSADTPATGGVSAADHAAANLIGKDRKEFNKWAFADPLIRKDTALQRSITDKSFIASLLQLGKVVEDGDGVFQVGEEVAAE